MNCQVGRIVIFPSTFVDSPRYMMQNYQDTMAIVRMKDAMRYLSAKRRARASANNSLTSLFLAQLTTLSPKGGSVATTTTRVSGRT